MSTVNLPAEQRVIFDDVKWETYLALAAETRRPGKRITYDQGVMEIMSPGKLHENAAALIRRTIDVFTMEHDIDVTSVASTTFKRDDLKRGFEADGSYYIANANAVRGKDVIDLTVDPPPDLVIEVDITRSSLNKFGIYGRLGVPEVWRYDGFAIEINLATGDESYTLSKRSRALPDFPIDEMLCVLERRHDESETTLIRNFRDYIRR